MDDTPIVESNEQSDSPEISLSAIGGEECPNTMRVVGKINGIAMIILLDSGSTDNFISQEVVMTLKLPICESVALQVGMASGDKIVSCGRFQDLLINIEG